jgi:hypothetical protein
MFKESGPQTASQNLSYEGENGIDEPDYVEMFAPKPLMLINTTGNIDDLFPAEKTQATCDEAKLFYAKLGAEDAVSFFVTSDIHLVGIDRASVAVLHAAALDTRFKKTIIRLAGETPWMDVVADLTIRDQMTHEVPGALMYYDIPGLVENGIAPREVEFADEPEIVDSSGIGTVLFPDDQYRNFPNPFSDRSLVSYTLERASDVTLEGFGCDGKKVKTIHRFLNGGIIARSVLCHDNISVRRNPDPRYRKANSGHHP